ncbi:ATP synthase small subunit 6, mitochondrial isoform X1 [Gossypium raimondii]|nr:ATP synthase small subunit 6, mitochondrial isoform X1 [Gossypium raimondii]
MKRWFDPWPVFFKREFNRTWPFLVGFAVTGTIITKFSLGLTEEDGKNSPFAQKHKREYSFNTEEARSSCSTFNHLSKLHSTSMLLTSGL